MKFCATCERNLPRGEFSKKQWRLVDRRRCKKCIRALAALREPRVDSIIVAGTSGQVEPSTEEASVDSPEAKLMIDSPARNTRSARKSPIQSSQKSPKKSPPPPADSPARNTKGSPVSRVSPSRNTGDANKRSPKQSPFPPTDSPAGNTRGSKKKSPVPPAESTSENTSIDQITEDPGRGGLIIGGGKRGASGSGPSTKRLSASPVCNHVPGGRLLGIKSSKEEPVKQGGVSLSQELKEHEMERAEQREQKDAASKVARLEDNIEVSNETEEVGSVANDALKGRKRTDHGVGMKAAAEKPIHKRAKTEKGKDPSAGGDVTAEALRSGRPENEEIAVSKKLPSSEDHVVPQGDQGPSNAVLENQPSASNARRECCPVAPFHVDVSAQKSFYKEIDLTPPIESYDDRFSAGGSNERGKGQWRVKSGDTVNVEVDQSTSKDTGVHFPFVVPWAPAEVVCIYKVHKTKESCASLRDQLSNEEVLATSYTQHEDSGEIMIEIRWFYRPWEIPGASKKPAIADSGELEEVLETDKIDICSADAILSPVRLHDTSRPSDAPVAIMGMPCIHYHCARLWSIHRRAFIPSGSLSNRVSRGRMYSEYKPVLDMLQGCTSVDDAMLASQQRDWKDAFKAAIHQLSLAAAAQDAQERGMVLACRETERDHIRSFLKKAISGKSQYGRSYSRGREDEETMNVKSSMFVAGPPGTGKTASVKSVITELQKEQHEGLLPEFKFIALNGMELRRPFDAYIKFWEALSGTRKENLTAGKAANALEYYFCGDQFDESDDESEDSVGSDDESDDSDEEDYINIEKEEEVFKVAISERPVTVLLLDEMDKLVTEKETLIYNLFDWPLRATTARLVVIGIANTIHLPEKMSPRVQSRIGGNRCYFKSYNVADTMTILKSRLGVLNETPGYEVFEEDAIKFASKKAANLTGDIRKAFRICKVAAEEVHDDLISGKRPMPENQRPIVRISDVRKSSRDGFTSMVIKAVSHCVAYEALFMVAIGALQRNREDGKFTIREILTKIESIANASGEPLYMDAHLSFSDVLGLASRLGSASIIQVDTYDSSPFPLVSTFLEPYEINGALRDTKHAKLAGKHLANQRLF